MVREQAGVAISECGQCVIGKRLRAEQGIRGATNGITAGHGNHVVKGRNVLVQAGQRGGKNGMCVDNRAHVRACGQHIPVQPPFARGLVGVFVKDLPVKIEFDHHFRRKRIRMNAGWRHQHRLAAAHADIAGGAAVQFALIQSLRRFHHGEAQAGFVRGFHALARMRPATASSFFQRLRIARLRRGDDRVFQRMAAGAIGGMRVTRDFRYSAAHQCARLVCIIHQHGDDLRDGHVVVIGDASNRNR